MVSVVFIVGMVNLVMGFVLALALERHIVLYVPRWQRGVAVPAAAAAPLRTPLGTVPNVVSEQVPDKWLAMLDKANAEYRTFTEASVNVLGVEVGAYRNDLLDIEDLVRSAIAKGHPQAIHDAVQELVALNEDWVARQRNVVRVMADKRDELGAYADLGKRLESLLLEQSPAVTVLCQEIVAIDPRTDAEAGEKIVRHLTQLVRLAHDLQDALQQAIVAIMVQEDRIESSDRTKHVDPLTGLRNRLGIEYQLRKWWRDDPDRQRLLSAALVDVERLGKTNEFASTRVADRMLQALAHMLKQQFGRDSGFEQVSRYSGHQFLLMFGDLGQGPAMAQVERIRQAVAGVLFEYRGRQYSLTIRAGVTAARRDEGGEPMLQRLGDLVAFARRDGGNRTCSDEGSKINVVPASPQSPPPRTITIE